MSEMDQRPGEGTPEQPGPRDAAYWAKLVSRLEVGEIPEGAVNLNVAGRRLTGPIQGFGKMWQKTFRVRLDGATASPADVIREWKQHFADFWPSGNRFYGPLTGIAPGDVAILNLSMGGMPLSTGVLVLYADDESFTLMSPEGHMLAGWITFSAFPDGETTVVQAQELIRANDPLYELGLALGGHRKQNRFWEHTLRAVAANFGVAEPTVHSDLVCVDRRRQWRNAKNIWHNAAIRSGLYTIGTPFRAVVRPFRRRAKTR